MITEFIRQCPCCQVMSRLTSLHIKTHPFTCASYNPFEVLHWDHIGPLRADVNGSTFILVIIDAFWRWVELYSTKTTTAVETASCIFQHFGRFGTPEVVHTGRGTAFHNEVVEELLRMSGTEQSLTTAYSRGEEGIVERANHEVLRHLNAILFDSRVYDRWSFEQLPMVQRIMNTVEKTSTGVTPAQLILNNSISLPKQILMSQRVLHIQDTTRPTGQIALSDRMDDWISDSRRQIIMLWLSMTQLLPSIQSTHMCSSHLQSVAVTSFFHDIEDHTKCWWRATRSTSSRIWLMVNEHRRTSITYDPSIMTLPGHLHWALLSRMSKSSLWNRSTVIVAIDSVEAQWNSRYVGQDSGSHAIVGSHIKLSTIICDPMQWRPWFQVDIRFSSEFFPSRHVDGFFHDWFLVDETPHISVHYFLIHIIIYISHYSILENGGPSSERRGYCDSAVRPGTIGIS